MKAKHILLSGLAATASALLMTGCSLEEYNPSAGPSLIETASTPEGFGKLVNSCYFPLTRSWTGGGEDYVVSFAEAGTDLWICPQGDNFLKELFTYDGLNGAVGHLKEGWQSAYEAINDCNAAIQLAEGAGFKTAAERDAKVAEAYFLRAFFNFWIVEQWGGKYLPTTYTTTPITNVPISSIDDVYALIFTDLKFAMQHLPKKQTEIGRATGAAAYHLYAKTNLQYAGYDNVTDKQKYWTEAKNAAVSLIDNQSSYGLKLYAEPKDIFEVDNNKTNTEAVWVATHSKNSSLNPRGGNYWNRVFKQFGALSQDGMCGVKWAINSAYVGMNRRIMPTKALLQLYGAKDNRYEAFFREAYYATAAYTWSAGDAGKFLKNTDEFVGKKNIAVGDTAMFFTRKSVPNAKTKNYACFDISLLFNADGTVNNSNTQYGYPALKKFDAPGMYNGELGKAYSWSDQLMYRLSETYLLAAEAAYRLGDGAGAANYFNVVRNRACAGHDGSMNISAGEINVDFILAERARELCGEYTRFMDLKRMGKTVMAQYVESNPNIKAKGKFDINTHWLRPVPSSIETDLQTNEDEFQNPGY